MPFYLIMEISAFLVSLLFFKRMKGTALIYFIPFLFLTVLVEAGNYLHLFIINGSNHLCYNIFLIIEYFFFYFFYYRITDNKKVKIYIEFCFAAYIAFEVINWSFLQGVWKFHSYSDIFGAFLLISVVLNYFRLLLITEEGISLIKFPYFWISTGVLFFYLGEFLIMSLFEYKAHTNDNTYYVIFRATLNAANILLYLFFIIGFVCTTKHPTTNYILE